MTETAPGPPAATLARAVFATTIGVGTALRGKRIFHPHGRTYSCRLIVPGTSRYGAGLLDEPGGHLGLVRVSRGAGVPHPLPDVEGLALRLPHLGVGGAPFDLLINSAWRFVFAPAALSPTWSSILAYRTGSGRRLLLGARPAPGGFAMLAAPPLGRWRPWGRLELQAGHEGEDLRFAPTVGADDLQPVELFRTLRAWSYEASQAGRS